MPKALILTSFVGILGESSTGGVSRFLRNTADALAAIGWETSILAPLGSPNLDGSTLFGVRGNLQPTSSAKTQGDFWPVVRGSGLSNACRQAHQMQDQFDVILNLNHDWLPYYLDGLFRTPFVHVPNLCFSDAATDDLIRERAQASPAHVRFLSTFQRQIFKAGHSGLMPFGLRTSEYELGAGEGGYLAWAGRIAPEKGLETAASWASACGLKLRVAGGVHDPMYWETICREHLETIDYQGYLSDAELRKLFGDATALLQTQAFDEALGVITIEALLCGAPVIAINRGANMELITHGSNGFLVPQNASDNDVAEVIKSVAGLSRSNCRASVAARFSIDAMAAGYHNWFATIG